MDGGALMLHKCFFNILQWEFNPDGTEYLQENSHKIEIQQTEEDKRALRHIKDEVDHTRRLTVKQQQQLLELTGEEYPINGKDVVENIRDITTDKVLLAQKWNRQIQKSLGFHTTPQGQKAEMDLRYTSYLQRDIFQKKFILRSDKS